MRSATPAATPRAAVARAALRAAAVGLAGWAMLPAAWASYGNMRLDGVAFLLAVVAIYFWGVVLCLLVALGLGRHGWFVAAATVVTLALAATLLGVWGDGRAIMARRPLEGWPMFALLSMAALPLLLAAPFLQRAGYARGRPSGLPTGLLIAALASIPTAALVHALLQEHLANQVVERAHKVPSGQLQQHVDLSRKKAAASWMRPYLWTEDAELRGVVLGFSGLPFVDSAAPLAPADTEALALLVRESESRPNTLDTIRLEGKLVWDQLVHGAKGTRVAYAAGLSRRQAQAFMSTYAEAHTDWLCAPLADAETGEALLRLWTLLSENDRNELSRRVLAKCGRPFGHRAR